MTYGIEFASSTARRGTRFGMGIKKESRAERLAKVGRVPGGIKSQDVLKKLGLADGEEPPKHLAAYLEVQAVFPDFAWTTRRVTRKSGVENTIVEFSGYPTIKGQAPSLADLVLFARGELELEFDDFTPKVSKRVAPLVEAGGATATEFAKVLVELPMVSRTPPVVMAAIGEWLKRAESGEPSTVFSCTCPDYAVDAEGRYTFDELCDGVGVVAKRVQAALPAMWQFVQQHGLDVSFVTAIGDFEADSDEVLARMQITREEFCARLRRSQEAFRVGLPGGMPLETPFATEIGDWYGIFAEAQRAAAQGRMTGPLELTDEDLALIVRARESLYKRWYGDSVDAKAVLLRQVPEYMAMGTLAERAFPNVLILAADATVMSAFEQGLTKQIRPIVYLRNVEY